MELLNNLLNKIKMIDYKDEKDYIQMDSKQIESIGALTSKAVKFTCFNGWVPISLMGKDQYNNVFIAKWFWNKELR